MDRACPHARIQRQLLLEESDFLNVTYRSLSKETVDRMEEEYELADKIIVPSEYSLKSFTKCGISLSKLHKASLEANFPIPKIIILKKQEIFTVGIAGGNPLRKGFYYLLKAWVELKIPKGKLIVKSSITELKKIKKIWDIIQSDQSIVIVEYFNNMQDFYKQCDVFCLPSIDDGFGMVVAEAMSFGLPVITTYNVGASELLTHNFDGYIVPIRDVESIKKYIEKLYLEKDLSIEIGKLAQNSYNKYKQSSKSYDTSIQMLYKNFGN